MMVKRRLEIGQAVAAADEARWSPVIQVEQYKYGSKGTVVFGHQLKPAILHSTHQRMGTTRLLLLMGPGGHHHSVWLYTPALSFWVHDNGTAVPHFSRVVLYLSCTQYPLWYCPILLASEGHNTKISTSTPCIWAEQRGQVGSGDGQ